MTSVLTNEGLWPWIPVLVIAMLTGMGGSFGKSLFIPKKLWNDSTRYSKEDAVWLGWRGWYSVTLPFQSVLVGMALTTLAFKFGVPPHPAFGPTLGGAALQGAFSGMLAVFAYDAFIDRIQYTIRLLGAKKGENEE